MSEIMITLGFVLISLLPGIMSFPQEIGVRIPNLCLTTSGSLCRFPFIFKGKRYTGCTYTESPTPWCATRVDTDDTVITNQWEDCDPFSCPIENINVPSCTTVSGPDPFKQCIFPFRHAGVVYNKCTTVGLDQPWCSTLTTSGGDHVSGKGKYGICPLSCPGVERTLNQTCNEGETFIQGCNSCICSEGKVTCTVIQNCGTCTRGQTWRDGCNTCTCSELGFPACTEKACLPSCKTTSGPASGQTCVFPFRWAGQEYKNCAAWIWSGENEGKLWCSTRTDINGNHVNGGGYYGFCPSSCINSDDDFDFDIDPRFGTKENQAGVEETETKIVFNVEIEDPAIIFMDEESQPS